jgi:hypothetical protein
MADFNVRSDSVNVEQIMEQIRARIREKRGVDYTEQQIRELAAVKLEKFLDPKGVRSDLLAEYRKAQPAYVPPVLDNYAFEESTLYETHRGFLRFIRKLLNPLLKLFFNPNPVIQALHIQSKLNTFYAEDSARREAARHATEQLNYELIHNLVVETTRLGIEVKNLKMRIESVTGRLEFNERRARALESVVVYKGPVERLGEAETIAPAGPAVSAQEGGQAAAASEGPGQRSRRRRRRRGRRSGGSAVDVMTRASGGAADASASSSNEPESDGEHEAPGAGARDDLDQFSGADSHPSEPVPPPAREPDSQ